ncbi:MAG: NAD(P)H-dependent oxidoreductase [Synechococcaceae cyanobacterium]|nr:NAD(P)H-dependent oxidoreductase [Synechococcaceae cyanobacterium]
MPLSQPPADSAPSGPAELLVIAVSHGQNLTLAERFAAAARTRGWTSSVLDLTAAPLPLFTARRLAADGVPAEALALRQQLARAGRWVICSPEYNGSIPPVLSNAIAWLSVQGEDFRGLFNERPIAIASHSGSGGTTMLAALRLQLAHLGAQVVGRQALGRGDTPVAQDSLEDVLGRLLRQS